MEDVKITITIKNRKTLLANAKICIETLNYGRITLKNFQIWQSEKFNERLQENINIAPPSVRNPYGKYLHIIFFEDLPSWFQLEGAIYEAYLKEIKDSEKEEEINLDEIPI